MKGFCVILFETVRLRLLDGSPRIISPVNVISDSGSEVAVILVTSMIGLSAVGGYFFLRKRKENI